jgi:hypothetical protein
MLLRWICGGSGYYNENANIEIDLWKLSIEICGKECGKIKMSVEMSMKTFHKHFYFPTFLPKNKNVYGNFPLTFVGRNVGK